MTQPVPRVWLCIFTFSQSKAYSSGADNTPHQDIYTHVSERDNEDLLAQQEQRASLYEYSDNLHHHRGDDDDLPHSQLDSAAVSFRPLPSLPSTDRVEEVMMVAPDAKTKPGNGYHSKNSTLQRENHAASPGPYFEEEEYHDDDDGERARESSF